jgi:hypothetical protein
MLKAGLIGNGVKVLRIDGAVRGIYKGDESAAAESVIGMTKQFDQWRFDFLDNSLLIEGEDGMWVITEDG